MSCWASTTSQSGVIFTMGLRDRYNAERGDVQAQAVVGQLHYQGGHGLERNYAEAYRHFSRAAAHGDSTSQAFLGEM